MPKTTTSPSEPVATTLSITSKNYASWSLRGWLLVKFSGLPFQENLIPPDDPDMRAEMLLLSSSVRVPRLDHGKVAVWDTLAIGEYLNEIRPEAGLLPGDEIARAHCRSICGEMHSGFSALRSSLPMNLKAYFPNFKVWSRAETDIARITTLWKDCLKTYCGPFLFGEKRCMADAMYAPVVTRFLTYDVKLDPVCSAYCERIMAMPELKEWIASAKLEPDDIEELDMEF